MCLCLCVWLLAKAFSFKISFDLFWMTDGVGDLTHLTSRTCTRSQHYLNLQFVAVIMYSHINQKWRKIQKMLFLSKPMLFNILNAEEYTYYSLFYICLEIWKTTRFKLSSPKLRIHYLLFPLTVTPQCEAHGIDWAALLITFSVVLW